MLDEIAKNSNELEMAYDVIRCAMRLIVESYGEPDLSCLKNAMYLASTFLNEELDQLEDETKELGLDKWQEAEMEKQREQNEREQEEREDEERENDEGSVDRE